MDEYKECSKCYTRLSIDNFTPHYQYWDKREGTCKDCRKVLKRTHSKIEQEQYRLTHYKYNKKPCSICKEELPLKDFCKISKFKDGLSYNCRSCSWVANKPYVPTKEDNNKKRKKKILFSF